MGIFLVFAIAGFVTVVALQRGVEGGERRQSIESLGIGAAGMPLLFAVYLATVPAYGARADLLFGFLLLIDAGLLAATIARRDEFPHALGGLATVLVFAIWLAAPYAAGASRTAVGFVAAFCVLFLAAPLIAGRLRRPLPGLAAQAVYVSPTLLCAFPVLARTAPYASAPFLLFLPLFALLVLIAWRALAAREFPLYFIAVFFALAAEAAWSAAHLTPQRLPAAVVIDAVFGVCYLGVPFVARRRGRPLEPPWAAGATLLISLALLLFLSAGPRPAASLWGLALLLAILNAGVFVESAAGALPWLSVAGGALSWIVLGVWWTLAAGSVGLLSSLLVIVGLALTMLGGHAWAHAQVARLGAARQAGFGFRRGSYLALIGQLFLSGIALQPEWAFPPWPLFGATAVLTLGVTATSLAVGEGALHAAGVVAAAAIALVWTATAQGTWSWTSLGAAEAVCAYALAWSEGRGRAPETARRAAGAIVALFLAEVILTAASPSDATAPAFVIVGAHVVNLSTVLALAWKRKWGWVAVAAVAPAWFAAATWQGEHGEPGAWATAFLFAFALYAVFAAYPFVLGRRAAAAREPSFAAVAGSGFFLFTARSALLQGGLGRFVGAVPVAEGAVLVLLLRQLLRFEPSGSRDLGRLALVTAAALGLATVAIPLQLRHQWITIGWAMEGVALAWTYRRIPHRGLLVWAFALLAVVFVRLTLNPAVFVYEPRGARVLNWYLYTYAICGSALIGAGGLFSATDDRIAGWMPRASGVLQAAGVIVLFLLLNIEIADYYAGGPEITFRFGVTIGQDLTYTIGWLAFGLALLTAGIVRRVRAARMAAIALIALTACKAFLYDMGSLGGLYRVASLVGLAVSLSLVALALQKFVLQLSQDQP